jgi:hypothetical protein
MTELDLERLAELLAPRVAAQVAAALGGAAPPSPRPRLLSRRELARELGKSETSIDRWTAQGMPNHDRGTFRLYEPDACAAWLAARRKPREARQPPATRPGLPTVAGATLRSRKAS